MPEFAIEVMTRLNMQVEVKRNALRCKCNQCSMSDLFYAKELMEMAQALCKEDGGPLPAVYQDQKSKRRVASKDFETRAD